MLSFRPSDRQSSTSSPDRDLDARRETGLRSRRAQRRPRVAARSPRETVESVVERTNTPCAGAVTVSTSRRRR